MKYIKYINLFKTYFVYLPLIVSPLYDKNNVL